MTSSGAGDLGGHCVLVTGAARGIGRAIALQAAGAGAAVAIADVNLAGATSVAAEIEALGRPALALDLDVSDEQSVTAALDVLARSRLGWPAVLVNNAGIQLVAPFLDLDAAAFDRTMAVNLRAVFCLSQTLARRWIAEHTRGVIVNIASTAGLVHYPLHAAYSVSKAGVRAATGAMALELARYGIRVNAVAPGYVQTAMSLAAKDPAARVEAERRIPLGRLGQPDDVARVAVFLASDASAYLTGQTLIVDGGLTLH